MWSVKHLLASCVVMMSAGACSWPAPTLDCGVPPLVTGSIDPSSGDSSMILWTSDGHGQDVLPSTGARDPVLSPDGRTVAFASTEGWYEDSLGWEQARVALLSLETREVTILSADIPASTVRNLAWLADGSEVAFSRWFSGSSREIAAVRVADGEERQLLELSAFQGFGSFAWSSDGRELLVPTSADPARQVGPQLRADELRRYSIDTGEYVVVETPHTSIGDVTWSPDGTMVALNADIPGQGRERLYVLDLETGDSQPVDRRRGAPRTATWSGQYLFYTYEVIREPESHIELMRWDGDSHERVQIDRPDLDPFRVGLVTVSAPACGGGQR